MRRLFATSLAVTACIGGIYANTITVKGLVKDSKTGEPIIGASIIQEGTTNGVITDYNGEYIINVSESAGLHVSYIGYITSMMSVDSKETLDIALIENTINLKELVVIGYGQESRKSNLSVAISKMEFDESSKSRGTDVIGAMQGRIAGVTIASNSGDPLSTPSVTIRGNGSRNGDKPLYVVDGVSGAPFNMEDVESITVLKDAASAAIYGTNVGSGGVIIITTKKAREGAIRVNARTSYGIQSAVGKPQMLNAQEYAMVRTDAAKVDGVSLPSGINPEIFPYALVTRTNWIDEIFRMGGIQRYALSLNGGSEALKGYASAEYARTDGTLLNTWSEKMGMKASLEFKVNNSLTISQRANFNYSNGQGNLNNSSHNGVIASAMFMPPSATVYEYDQNGNHVYDEKGSSKFGGTVPLWAKDLGVAGTFGEIANPVATLMRLRQSRPEQELFSTTSIEVNPISHLKFRSDISVGTNNQHYDDFSYRVTEIGKTNDQNARTISNYRNYRWLWENVATYDQSFGNHSLNLMGGYSMSYFYSHSSSTTVYNFDDESQFSQDFVNGNDWTKSKPYESRNEESQVSAYLRGAYSYGDRYFFTGSIRRDASSKLYFNNNSGYFPAVSGAWKISSEPFLKDAKAISLLKLRASWGQVGNVNGVRNYSYLSNLSALGDYAYLGNQHQNPILGLGMVTIPNQDLRWEISEQTDLGFDIELLEGRFSFGMDWYLKNTKDLIEEVPLPSVSGISVAPLGNIGSVQNRGFEFTVGYTDQTKSGFSYSVDVNVSTLKSKVKDLGNREFFAHSNTIRAIQPLRSAVGQEWYSYYLIKNAGIFQNQAEIDAYIHTDASGKTTKIQPNAKPGDLKFVDQNGDGIINDNDRQFMGSYTPKVTYGLNAQFGYKNFDLSMILQGVAGNKIFNGVKVMTYAAGQGWNMSKDVLNSWGYNSNSGIPLISMSDSNGNYSTASDLFLEDGSYLRIKNITLGYSIPSSIFKSSTAPKIRLYASGENLFTFTKYSGMDPEVGNYGLDGGTYPVSRVFSFGMNLTF